MVKNAFIIITIGFLLPAYTAITLLSQAEEEKNKGEQILFLKHHPAQFSKTPATDFFNEEQQQLVKRDFIANLPKDLDKLDVKSRKNQFIATLLPLILRVNELIYSERSKIINLQTKSQLSQSDKEWLMQVAIKYRLKNIEASEINFSELLLRVDLIPPSLALAQAAIESGWGTSRFAKHANALYGQWTWSDNDNAGMVPLGRGEGETHRIKSFPYLIQSVEAYALNLNSHFAYEDFRKTRANDKNSTNLTHSLISYSTRREAYVNDLQAIIRVNKLSQLDHKKLMPTWVRQ